MIKRHKFGGRYYAIKFKRRKEFKNDGTCDNPKTKNREICINNSIAQKQNRLMEVAIHEALHACMWDIDEEKIDETSIDIASFLWRLGFRREED